MQYIIAACLGYWLGTGVLPAANYYVSPGRSDGNNGTGLSAPFKTIQQASGK